MPADRSTKLLLIILSAMFLQQTFATFGRQLPPIIAPAILADLALDPAWLGFYVSAAAASALLFQLGCGSFILRYGAMRMSQVALVMLGLGLALGTVGPNALLFLVSGVIGGGAAAMSTPASSHLLGRYSPPKQAPLVFSVKQTAVPAGLLAVGLLGPWLTGATGWRGTLLIAAAACIVFAAMLEPLRKEFDSDRVPTQTFRLSDFHTTILSVLGAPDLRRLSFACFAFNGLQTVFTSYFVVALTELGHGLAAAGLVFSVAMIIAVPGRLFWGWLGSGRVDPAVVICWLALGMAGGSAAMALLGAHWPLVLVGVVATVLSATVMSWHGILLSEAARLAPAGQRGAATGGVLSFGQLGGLLLPLVYSAALVTTGSYGLGFAAAGLPALVVGIVLLRAPREHEAR
ncbi:MFS transporter [Roseomonas terrae]|jgi:MFS family permease|uniref:MFS transporter n=1 Tax=Neoroseomonas terrae TaxID=424799 RepID=A0ABS5EDD8_9PROT|nr:MFS transporter [Neoroseomonas terrae]MBR0649036.1 MFS transporter [Neoroseomonas terrae]